MPTTKAAPVLLTIEEAAEYLRRNVPYLRRLIARREIPYYRLGARLRFDTRDLDAHLAACRVEARP